MLDHLINSIKEQSTDSTLYQSPTLYPLKAWQFNITLDSLTRQLKHSPAEAVDSQGRLAIFLDNYPKISPAAKIRNNSNHLIGIRINRCFAQRSGNRPVVASVPESQHTIGLTPAINGISKGQKNNSSKYRLDKRVVISSLTGISVKAGPIAPLV